MLGFSCNQGIMVKAQLSNIMRFIVKSQTLQSTLWLSFLFPFILLIFLSATEVFDGVINLQGEKFSLAMETVETDLLLKFPNSMKHSCDIWKKKYKTV